uniref:Uncharacterized protein n=1 Tax=Escherichia coli TaxID=562 RepID=A0A3Q8VK11_ECOLX|nr:hypothetical protein [Escherichia coli]
MWDADEDNPSQRRNDYDKWHSAAFCNSRALPEIDRQEEYPP